MSIHSVKQYQAEVEKIMHYGGTKKETAIRTAFQNLLNEYAKQKGLLLIPEITIRTLPLLVFFTNKHDDVDHRVLIILGQWRKQCQNNMPSF